MATIRALKLLNRRHYLSQWHSHDHQSDSPQVIIRSVKKWFTKRDMKYIIPNEVKDESIDKLRTSFARTIIPEELADLRFAFPEFLPSPNVEHRDKVLDKLMRIDMVRRRKVLDIPEFYVGTIMSVIVSDPFAPGKESRFMGICIDRQGQGMFANFTLRNRVDNQGVEIRYDLYNPTIREIQVIKLEKRVDEHLWYLRDALPEYSTFPFDMTPEPHPDGQPVPVNPLKVVMKPWPWTQRWDIKNLSGIKQYIKMPDWRHVMSWPSHNHLEQFDLMKSYREHIPEDDQYEIWQQIKDHQEKVAEIRKIERRKRLLSQTEKVTER